MRMFHLFLALSALIVTGSEAPAQSELQQSLKDTDIAPHWIYDDLPRAQAEAKASAKPLLVVLRCVPCPPGRSLDTLVMKPDKDLEKLEQQFVCVRVIQARGLDLKRFQYDLDQSWCAFFLNADGTIYGRYGTRATSGPQSDATLSLPSFRKAMERALDLHKNYPANKDQLAAKTGKDPEYRVPEVIPGLQDKAKGPTTRQTCIHCHMVKEYALRAKWKEKRLSPTDLWVYPLPDAIGLKVDVDDGLRIKSVVPGSPAAKAGLGAGDALVTLNGQPLLSQADIQWVLHTAPVETTLAATIRRGGELLEKAITLGGKWKEGDIAWRASSWYGLRQGLKVETLSSADKQKRGLAGDSLALVIRGLFGPGGQTLTKAGLKQGDVIVAIDGKSTPVTESQFLANLRLEHGPDDSIKLTILRGDNRQELTIPMW